MTRILMTACCACAAVGALWLTGCGKPRENITMAGSTAFQPFAEKLADQYMNAHPEVAITIQGGGSALGIQSALSGTAQIGMADLVTLPKEAEAMKSMVVARDGIAVVFNPANAVTALTLEQVRGLFSGTIKNWKELGGADHALVEAFQRGLDRGARLAAGLGGDRVAGVPGGFDGALELGGIGHGGSVFWLAIRSREL